MDIVNILEVATAIIIGSSIVKIIWRS